MHAPVLALHAETLELLVPRLASCFPNLCESHSDDALSEAWRVLCEDEANTEAVWRAGGRAAVMKLLFKIAWRYLRGLCRRASYLRELPLGPVESKLIGVDEAGLILTHQVMALITRAARGFGPERAPGLQLALEDRVLGGYTDTEAAARHDVRREYLNRARRSVGEALAADGYGPMRKGGYLRSTAV